MIPEVVAVLADSSHAAREIPQPPTRCPVCEAHLVRKEGEAAIRCSNRLCPAQVARGIMHFASRGAMDIDGLGEKLILRLLDLGVLRDISDIYRLASRQDELVRLERLGAQSIGKLLAAIEASKEPSLSRFIYSLGIRHVGAATASELARAFGGFDRFRNATYEELVAIPDIGPATAAEIVEFFQDGESAALVDSLLELGVLPRGEKVESGRFVGKTIVFTGKLERLTREEAEERVRSEGGTAASSVGSATSLVVAGPGAGSKLEKAEKLGIEVISEADFLEMLDR